MSIDELAIYAATFKKILDLSQRNTLAVTDLEKYVYIDDGLGLNVKKGEKIEKGSATYEILEQKQPLKKLIHADESVFGKEYESLGFPIENESGELIGALVWAIPTDSLKLASMAEELLALAEQVSASSETFAQSSTELASANEQLFQQVSVLRQHMDQIGDVNGLVAELATESHILGINAAIEAARAKEYGTGFNVVAEEIRRLAHESKQSAKSISNSVGQTNEQVSLIAELTEKVAQMGEEQSAGAQELSAAVQHINDLATNLNQLSAQK